jgi:hypothetical protein
LAAVVLVIAAVVLAAALFDRGERAAEIGWPTVAEVLPPAVSEIPAGFGSATWALDPAFPSPGPTATKLHVLQVVAQGGLGAGLANASMRERFSCAQLNLRWESASAFPLYVDPGLARTRVRQRPDRLVTPRSGPDVRLERHDVLVRRTQRRRRQLRVEQQLRDPVRLPVVGGDSSDMFGSR